MINGNAPQTRKHGFTLIELLVVMAITTILLGLVFGPLVQGFNLTNRARVQVLAQDTARNVMESVQRETANGVFVFDYYSPNDPVFLRDAKNAVYCWVSDIGGNVVPVLVPYTFVDMVPPARVIDQNAGVPDSDIDPTTGLPVSKSPDVDPRYNIATPLAPGRTITRYWLGLRSNASTADAGGSSGKPIKPYVNFYEDVRGANQSDHNPYILYKATFSPYVSDGAGGFKIDDRLIDLKDANGKPRSLYDALRDPNFFYDNNEASGPVQGWQDLNKDGKVNFSENWKAIARAMLPSDRADAMTIERDSNKKPVYTSVVDPRDIGTSKFIKVPKFSPLVRFQPTYVGNDAGAPTSKSDAGNEAPNTAPPSYVEAYGHWTTPYRLYVFRRLSADNPLSERPLNYFFEDGSGSIFLQQFDTTTGQVTSNTQIAGFPLDATGHLNLINGANPRPQVMFTTDAKRGVVNFSFPHWITQKNSDPLNGRAPLYFGTAAINQVFDKTVANDGGLADRAYRTLDLGTLDTTLNPNIQTPLQIMNDGSRYIPKVQIVPGTEVVKGPDMRPGPNFGKPIIYTRVARNDSPKNIGLNEYMINYTDVPNLGQNDILGRMGTIIFDSQPNSNGVQHALAESSGSLTVAPIEVSFQIQNNLTDDVVKADYLTRQLMSFQLGVRLYEFNSGQPQQVNLTQKIRVRNLQR